MLPVLGIPFYNREDLLIRCLASIDAAVGHVVIVDNSPEQSVDYDVFNLRQRGLVKRAWRGKTIIKHPNAGVAASWNEIIKLFPARWWLLANNDIEFASGDLDRMASAMVDGVDAAYGNHGASWWGVSGEGIRRVGLFDENFYPAYLEDCDWNYRADLTGANRINVEGCASIHGAGEMTGSCTIMSDPIARDDCHRTHAGNFEYYKGKWGGINGEEKFTRPYNVPEFPVACWWYLPHMRIEQQWRK